MPPGPVVDVMIRGVVALAFLVLAVGCGDDSSSDAGADAGSSCDQILDRWVEIQQQLFVDLDEAEERGLSEDAVAALAAGTASGLFENSRDATRLGCETVLQAGTSALCARIADLETTGPPSQAALADLEAGCAG